MRAWMRRMFAAALAVAMLVAAVPFGFAEAGDLGPTQVEIAQAAAPVAAQNEAKTEAEPEEKTAEKTEATDAADEAPETPPASTPEPTLEATNEPAAVPSAEATSAPTSEATAAPTIEATIKATIKATAEAGSEPTPEPTTEPTIETTIEPTVEPTTESTLEPTNQPTPEPAPEFIGLTDGDTVEAGSDIEIMWRCEGGAVCEAEVLLLAEAPDLDAEREVGEAVPFARDGESVFLRVPEQEDRYLRLRVQIEGGAAATLYLKIVRRDDIAITGKDRIVAGKTAVLKAYSADGKAISAKKLTWRSSDKKVAAVSSSGKVTAKKAGTACITATDKNGLRGTLEITVLPKAGGVTILYNGEAAGKSISVDIGTTTQVQLAAAVAPEAAMQEVSWKSGSTKIASVDALGNVTLRKTGTVSITATAKDGSGKKASVKLNIKRLMQGLEISGATELGAGMSATLKAAITPSNASSKALRWVSSDPAIAGVNAKGKVTAKAVTSRRSVVITAAAEDGSGVIAEHEITICPATSEVRILLDGEAVKTARAAVGSSLQLEAEILPAEAMQTLKWASSDKKIAKVDANGLVTPVKAGSVTISATAADGKKAGLKLTVSKANSNGDFEYIIVEDMCIITRYTGTKKEVVIPAAIKGANVAYIGDEAFRYSLHVTGVHIPDGVVGIGEEAFAYCTCLQSVRIPESATYIGQAAFDGCYRLKSVRLPSGMTEIEDAVFHECRNLTSVTIPDGVTRIGDSVFKGCESLESVRLPSSLASVGEFAFAECVNLREINIPASMRTIRNRCFRNCHSIREIDVSANISYIGYEAFLNCDGLREMRLSANMTYIGDAAFRGCTNMTAINIPYGVTYIGYEAFQDCSSLTSLEVPYGVTEIYRNTFDGCTRLENIRIADSVTKIEKSAFDDCPKLNISGRSGSYAESFAREQGLPFNGVTLPAPDPDPVENFEYSVSNGECVITECKEDATKLVIPAEIDGVPVTRIGEKACYMKGYVKSLTLSEGIREIDGYAFYYCTGLRTVNLPESLTRIGECAFFNCNMISDVVLPAGLTELGEGAFYNSYWLSEMDIPDGVTVIQNGVFERCTSLERVKLPKNLRKIGYRAFEHCGSLRSIDIPDGTTFIDWRAFAECYSLKRVTIPASVQEIGENAFIECSEELTIYGEAGSYAEAYAKENGIPFQAVNA